MILMIGYEGERVSVSTRDLQIQKTYETLFALEDLRELFRQSLPTGFNDAEKEEFARHLSRVKATIEELDDDQ